MTEKPAIAWEWVDPAKLRPYEKNARVHNPGQVKQIAESIREFGWRQAIMVDGQGEIIAGHGRYEAAKLLSETLVPVVIVRDLPPEKIRLLRIADNKIAENSTWDKELLSVELADLSELNIDLSNIGFDMGEIDKLIGSVLDSEDLVPLDADTDATRSGATTQQMTFAKHKVPLTEDEAKDLDRLLHVHITRTGSKFGFARSLIEAANARPQS